MFRSPASARDTVDGDSPSLSANSLIVIRFMLAGVDSDKTTDFTLLLQTEPNGGLSAPRQKRTLR